MKYQPVRMLLFVLLMATSLAVPTVSAGEPQISPRMEKAKDYIADEQWIRAIELLRVVAADPKEKNRDEALYWLAHSRNQAKDLAGAIETIKSLEQQFPKSRWVKPAGYIRVEVAQKLRREDVLWTYAETPQPAPPARVFPTPAAGPVPATAPPPPRPTTPGRGPRPPAPAAGPLPGTWVSEATVFDNDVRIQALSSLIRTDAPKVIPMLREIALESRNPREASRAVFVLAQSGQPAAHSAVLEVAKVAVEPVSVAAVRELGRFGGETVPHDLLQVYEVAGAKPRVRYQVVTALGERAATTALMQIAESESDSQLRNIAIVTLGQAGGRAQLARLYGRASAESKRAIITGLFNAGAEDELIRIAQQERDADLRARIHDRLRLLGTPKAKAYLERAASRR